ncbi:MLP-like protein 31 [Linum perenne]
MSLLLKGKLEAQFWIRLPANEFHDIFSCRPHHVSNMAPNKIKNCAMHEGGVHKVAKELIEDIDDVNLSTTFKVIEGDITKDYKEFKLTVKATPETADTSLVHWTIVYEKLKEEFPDSDAISILDFVVHMSKDIDDHHVKIKNNN